MLLLEGKKTKKTTHLQITRGRVQMVKNNNLPPYKSFMLRIWSPDFKRRTTRSVAASPDAIHKAERAKILQIKRDFNFA